MDDGAPTDTLLDAGILLDDLLLRLFAIVTLLRQLRFRSEEIVVKTHPVFKTVAGLLDGYVVELHSQQRYLRISLFPVNAVYLERRGVRVQVAPEAALTAWADMWETREYRSPEFLRATSVYIARNVSVFCAALQIQGIQIPAFDEAVVQ